MSVYLSSLFGAGAQLFSTQGVVLAGGSISTYLAGTSTPALTWTTNVGNVNNPAVITLDSGGRPPQQIWLTAGVLYKFIVKDVNGVQVGLAYDNIPGVNDPTASIVPNTEWISLSATPSYISTSSFSVTGDQRTLLPVGQRLKLTETAGTVYATVLSTVFSTVTTVVVQVDSTNVDSGLSAVSYGLFNAGAPSISAIGVVYDNAIPPPSTFPNAAQVLQRADRALTPVVTGGTATAYTLTPTPALAAYATNAPILIKAHVASGVAPTIAISGLGALSLKQLNSSGSKIAAVLVINQVVQVVYDGVDMVLVLPPSTSAGRFLRLTPFTTGGTWTKGSDVGSIMVEGVGGGGGVAPSIGSGGGGAGGYFKKHISAPAASYTIGVAAGGNTAGTAGGNTTFDVLCTANGGLGVAGALPPGGAGGTATGGDINLPGGGGGWGGSLTNAFYGAGGNSVFGGGAMGNENNATGVAGGANTGGGASGGSAAGAIGGTGLVLVYEYS